MRVEQLSRKAIAASLAANAPTHEAVAPQLPPVGVAPSRLRLYQVLRVQPDASAEQIDEAYRQRIAERQSHPQAGNPQIADEIALIKQAYEVLGNPVTRGQYDSRASMRQASKVPTAVTSVSSRVRDPGGEDTGGADKEQTWLSRANGWLVLVLLVAVFPLVVKGVTEVARATVGLGTWPVQATLIVIGGCLVATIVDWVLAKILYRRITPPAFIASVVRNQTRETGPPTGWIATIFVSVGILSAVVANGTIDRVRQERQELAEYRSRRYQCGHQARATAESHERGERREREIPP